MDPNETLRQLRLTIAQMRVDEHPGVRKAHADEVAEYFEALDEWLSKGGFLPDAWAPPKPEAAPRRFYVVNNVTGERVVKGFETEDAANRMCYDMNLRAGPGGLYGVENEKGERI